MQLDAPHLLAAGLVRTPIAGWLSAQITALDLVSGHAHPAQGELNGAESLVGDGQVVGSTAEIVSQANQGDPLPAVGFEAIRTQMQQCHAFAINITGPGREIDTFAWRR